MANDIRFLKIRDPNGHCSNFYPRTVRYGGKVWLCNEPLYQAQKHRNTHHYDVIHAAPTAWAAMKMGRSQPLLNSSWDLVKDDTMRTCCFLKYIQNGDIREELLATDRFKIVEAGAHDSYWAEGPDGKGLNRLGIILMEVRAVLRLYGSSDLEEYVTALSERCGMEAALQKSDLREFP